MADHVEILFHKITEPINPELIELRLPDGSLAAIGEWRQSDRSWILKLTHAEIENA